jgi:hypothetical protein
MLKEMLDFDFYLLFFIYLYYFYILYFNMGHAAGGAVG